MIAKVGVDGCKVGWFWFCKSPSSVSFGVAPNIEELARALPVGSRICIDIPIGLIDSGSEGRVCDIAARRALGFPRATSVFPAPAYPVLNAKDYPDAKRLSLDAIGKKLSKQAYLISPKIREVNDFLLLSQTAGYDIREVHPEVCFWALNKRQAMRHSKKRSSGFEERLTVLERYLPNARELAAHAIKKFKRSEVDKDDILDTLVTMLTACATQDNLKTLPPNPPRDSRGLPMEIVYIENPKFWDQKIYTDCR